MTNEPIDHSQTDPEEMQALATLVAKAIAKGDSREEVIADLTNNGWERDDADQFVASVETQLASMRAQQAPQTAGGEGMGWALWIGGILGINLLSYLFNWGFWIY